MLYVSVPMNLMNIWLVDLFLKTIFWLCDLNSQVFMFSIHLDFGVETFINV